MSSFGSLFHFNKKNAPENSTEKCCDCPCTECPYSAIKIYRGSYSNIDNWPLSVVLSSEIHNVIESETNKDIEDLMEHDPGLQLRGALVSIEHARLGVFGHVRSPMSFSADVIAPFRPPNMGEHSQFIAQHLSGLDDSRVDTLTAAGVFK